MSSVTSAAAMVCKSPSSRWRQRSEGEESLRCPADKRGLSNRGPLEFNQFQWRALDGLLLRDQVPQATNHQEEERPDQRPESDPRHKRQNHQPPPGGARGRCRTTSPRSRRAENRRTLNFKRELHEPFEGSARLSNLQNTPALATCSVRHPSVDVGQRRRPNIVRGANISNR